MRRAPNESELAMYAIAQRIERDGSLLRLSSKPECVAYGRGLLEAAARIKLELFNRVGAFDRFRRPKLTLVQGKLPK